MPLENRNNAPNAVFVPTSGGLFRRFNSMTGRPMDAGPADAHGLFDRDGKMAYGRLPGGMALDAAPTFQPAPDPKPPTSGAVAGSRDQGAGGTITREQAAAIHDMAHHAGCDETTMDGLGRALAAITGTAPAAKDQNGGNGGAGGGQKISRGEAHRIWSFLQPKLSPQDLDKATQLLSAMVDESLPDPDEGAQGQAQDQPPRFRGMPQTGGQITGDAAYQEPNADLADALSGVARIRPDDHYGQPVPKSRYLREAESARMALDERTRASGSSLEDFARDWPEVARIGRAY